MYIFLSSKYDPTSVTSYTTIIIIIIRKRVKLKDTVHRSPESSILTSFVF